MSAHVPESWGGRRCYFHTLPPKRLSFQQVIGRKAKKAPQPYGLWCAGKGSREEGSRVQN